MGCIDEYLTYVPGFDRNCHDQSVMELRLQHLGMLVTGSFERIRRNGKCLL